MSSMDDQKGMETTKEIDIPIAIKDKPKYWIVDSFTDKLYVRSCNWLKNQDQIYSLDLNDYHWEIYNSFVNQIERFDPHHAPPIKSINDHDIASENTIFYTFDKYGLRPFGFIVGNELYYFDVDLYAKTISPELIQWKSKEIYYIKSQKRLYYLLIASQVVLHRGHNPYAMIQVWYVDVNGIDKEVGRMQKLNDIDLERKMIESGGIKHVMQNECGVVFVKERYVLFFFWRERIIRGIDLIENKIWKIKGKFIGAELGYHDVVEVVYDGDHSIYLIQNENVGRHLIVDVNQLLPVDDVIVYGYVRRLEKKFGNVDLAVHDIVFSYYYDTHFVFQ